VFFPPNKQEDKLRSPTEPLSDKESEEALLRRPRALSNSFKDYVDQGLVSPSKKDGSIQDFA
jgi:hypothetical protein